jgi:DNA-binding YbaB/EbfC family protein
MMKNIGQMMKEAQKLQQRMGEFQEKLAAIEISGASGGGMVQITLNGKGDLRRVKIDPSLLDPAEVEMLEDLILAASSDAKAKLDAHVAEKMAELTGGLKLPPGMNFPV